MTELSRTEKALGVISEQLAALEEKYAKGEAVSLDEKAEDEKTVAALHAELVGEISTSVEKFQRRAQEKDAVTGKEKYGEKYRKRATAAFDRKEELYRLSLNLMEDLSGAAAAAEAKMAEEERRRRVEEECKAELEAKRKSEADAAASAAEKERIQREAEEKQERIKEAAAAVAEATRTEEDRIYLKYKERIDKFMSARNPGEQSILDALSIVKDCAAIDDQSREKSTYMLKQVATLLEKIIAHPESEAVRTINVLNDHFQQDIVHVPGSIELLIACGFKLLLRVEVDDKGVETKYIELLAEEPDLATQMDEWESWFNHLKTAQQIVKQASL